MQFTKESLKEEQKIIIYGASVYGELALRGLENLGLRPVGFADRASNLKEYLGYPVMRPEELAKHKKDCILVASADFFYEMVNYLESLDCEYIFDISYLLQLQFDLKFLSNRAKEMYDARDNYFKAVQGTDFTIIHLGFCVSEKCSLKCRDCSFLMQYYENPQNIDVDKYKPALDRFLKIVDYISEFRVYGGEPFMNPNIYKIVEWYKDCEKIGTISIYTNGTIVPNEHTLKCLEEQKVKVHISDYEHNRDKVKKLVKILEDRNITYFIRKYDTWQQAGDLSYKDHSVAQLTEIYASCFATNCYSFLKGKFYACPRAAHATNLKAIPDVDNDRVDFTNATISDEDLGRQLYKLMHEKKYIDACKYCEGLNNHVVGIKPAIQISKPLQYEVYS